MLKTILITLSNFVKAIPIFLNFILNELSLGILLLTDTCNFLKDKYFLFLPICELTPDVLGSFTGTKIVGDFGRYAILTEHEISYP